MDTSQHSVWSIPDRLVGTLPSSQVFAHGAAVAGRGMLVWPCPAIYHTMISKGEARAAKDWYGWMRKQMIDAGSQRFVDFDVIQMPSGKTGLACTTFGLYCFYKQEIAISRRDVIVSHISTFLDKTCSLLLQGLST